MELGVFACILGLYLSLLSVFGCPPGTYIHTESNTCEKCPSGSFSTQNNSEKCTRCAGCPGQNGHVIYPCNSTADTKCGCDPGYYYGPVLICIRCEQCRRGRGVKQNCSENKNTVCETCVKGKTFSPRKGLKPCIPCSRCPEGFVVKKNCTRRSDTECIRENDINDTKEWPAITRPITRKEEPARSPTISTNATRFNPSNLSDLGSTRRATQIQVSTTSKDLTTISLLSGLVGVFLITLFVSVTCYCHRRRQRRGRRHTRSRTRQPPDAASEASISSTGMTIQDNRGSLVPLMTGQKDKLFRNTSCGLVEELSLQLNPNRRWKKLAQKLNFNNTQVNNLAIEPNKATEKLLVEWGHRNGSTLSCLRKILLELKWKYEAEIVAKYM